MNVIFFEVDGVLNSADSEAKAPSGRLGIAEPAAKALKALVPDNNTRIVLTGSWTKEWDFDDIKCTSDGTYLNKKLGRRGLHIMDKTDDIPSWLARRGNVESYIILKSEGDLRKEQPQWIQN